MSFKYWRLKLKGERPVDEIQSTAGRRGAMIVRTHVEGGETHVYLAAEESSAVGLEKAMKDAEPLEEVSADEVTKIR